MLHIYVGDYDETDIVKQENFVYDVEAAFAKLKLKGTDLERKALKELEQAQWLDGLSFLDRFGYKLYNRYISTGCKTALLVINCPDCIVNAVEAGFEVRDFIIKYCKEGAIYLSSMDVTINRYQADDSIFSDPIAVEMDGKHFTDIRVLNSYIAEPMPELTEEEYYTQYSDMWEEK